MLVPRYTYVERKPKETANDRNDRAIRRATAFYKEKLERTGLEVVLLTNDHENRKLAEAEKLNVYTSKGHSFIFSFCSFKSNSKIVSLL